MSRQWTAAQSAAMNTTDKTLLVSAAAGSGKTATLTQRIINRLTDKNTPGDLSTMLIVTFTQAAAAELKGRIFSALGDALAKDPANRHLTEQLVKLGNARICTIDAFYLELIRSHFSELGLSPNFRIADQSELELLAMSVMEDTIDRFYETDDSFPLLAEILSGTRNTKALCQALIAMAEKVASLPEGVEFIRISAEKTARDSEAQTDFLSTDFGQLLRRETLDAVSHYCAVFEAACEYARTDTPTVLESYAYDLDFFQRLSAALHHPTEGYRMTRSVLEDHAPIRLRGLKEAATETSEMYKALRTAINKAIKEKLTPTFARSPEELCMLMGQTAIYTHALYRVLLAYEQAMEAEKQRRNVLNFHDIRRKTLALLVEPDGSPTEVAKKYAVEFSEIYIDEYQDVDRVQDLIFRSIAKPDNRFMVGDIKQSIYGFRGAEPSLFAGYRKTFPPLDQASDSTTATIFMSENFRCDQTVIDFTNRVCSLIFSSCADSIGYTEADDLRFAKFSPSEDYRSPKVQVTVLTPPPRNEEEPTEGKTEAFDKLETEAEYIAEEIVRLLTQKTKKADDSALTPGDIAILFRSRAISPYLTKALNRRGILTSDSDSERYFESPDVLMTLCLLNTVDNPHRDIFLSGTLRSPLFGFTMNDLIRIRSSADRSFSLYDALLVCKEEPSPLGEKCAAFDRTLSELRSLSVSLSVDRFLRVLFESDLFVHSGFVTPQTEDGEGGNLLRLYEYARTFESGSFKGLYNFIEFINNLIEEGKKLKMPPKGRSADRVTLSTIHLSKGLEFPVCFVCNAGASFNERDQQSPILCSYPTGIATKLTDRTGFARINTPMRDALAGGIAVEGREEQMRTLYVALTRARERLYVTGFGKFTPEKLMATAEQRAKFCTRHTILSCSSYLDWILLAFAKVPDIDTCASLSFMTAPPPKETTEPSAASESEAPSPPVEADETLYAILKEKYAFQYPYAHLRKIPAKLSVSRLSPDILDENDTSVDLFSEKKKATIPDFFLGKKQSSAPANERGTATHLFLQFCNLFRARRSGAKEELCRLVTEQYLPENIAELVYLDELDRFLNSELADRILSAERVIREQRFNLLMDATDFTADPVLCEELRGEKLAVQGVIDLILIDADGTLSLYDYKTDRLSREELADPALAKERMNRTHGRQLSYYAYAAEQIFGKPCHRLCVYSTCSARLYDIAPQPPMLPKDFLDTL